MGSVSHELRKPAQSVRMWARALQGGGVKTDRMKRGLEAVERGAGEQAEMIEESESDTARIEWDETAAHV